MIKINYESDFKLVETLEERFWGYPFDFEYMSSDGSTYKASFDGGVCDNCKVNPDGSVTVIFNNHGLGVGKLRVRREFHIPDADFKDGIYNMVTTDSTEVLLVDGKTDGVIITSAVVLPVDGYIDVNKEKQLLVLVGCGVERSSRLRLYRGDVKKDVLVF